MTEASVYDAQALMDLKPCHEGFDATYFSGSLSLMSDPVSALRAAALVTKRGGHIYVTQTYQRRRLPLLSYVKPMLKYVTTIDFGALMSVEEAKAIFASSEFHFKVIEHETIPGSVDNFFQAAHRTILRVVR